MRSVGRSARLDLRVGPALADINGEPFVVGERRRLEELRLAATEDYFAAELAGARHSEAVGELERMVDRHPLRERLGELLITALYRSGRQADALAAYQRLRRILADELGIQPSAPLQLLEHRVLVQDTRLAAPSTSPGPLWPIRTATSPGPPRRRGATPRHNPLSRPRRGLATTALVPRILSLGLFWIGVVSTLIALLAVVCGTDRPQDREHVGPPAARRADSRGRHGRRRVVGEPGLLLCLRRLARPATDPADSQTADRTEAPDGSQTADRTTVSNESTR